MWVSGAWVRGGRYERYLWDERPMRVGSAIGAWFLSWAWRRDPWMHVGDRLGFLARGQAWLSASGSIWQ